jgi:hypothetical protein
VLSVQRLEGNPIIDRATSPSLGANINGPSLVAAPPWLDEPLGRYYLYFAHHRGTSIRLATADKPGASCSDARTSAPSTTSTATGTHLQSRAGSTARETG